jgi:hypothetical protein
MTPVSTADYVSDKVAKWNRVVAAGEKETWGFTPWALGPGGSLRTHLHTVYMEYAA